MDHRPGAMSYWDLNYTDQVPSLTGTSTADHSTLHAPHRLLLLWGPHAVAESTAYAAARNLSPMGSRLLPISEAFLRFFAK